MNVDKLKQTLLIYNFSINALKAFQEDGIKELQELGLIEKDIKGPGQANIRFTSLDDKNIDFAESHAKFFQMIPMMILISFQIELMLKLIIYEETKKSVRGHEIHRLFQQISLKKRKEIIQTVITENKIKEKDFNDYLVDNNRVFEEWRYHHEPKPKYKMNNQFLISLYYKLFRIIFKNRKFN
jgi:hypothetical protein